MVGRLMESGTYLGAEYRLESRADQVISLLVSPIDPEMLVSYFHILLACASSVQICAEMIAPLFFFSYYLFLITFFPTYSACSASTLQDVRFSTNWIPVQLQQQVEIAPFDSGKASESACRVHSSFALAFSAQRITNQLDALAKGFRKTHHPTFRVSCLDRLSCNKLACDR